MKKNKLNIKEIQEWLIKQISFLTDIETSNINIHESFKDYGISSREAVTLSGDLEELLGRKLPPTLAYDYPNISALSNYLIQGDLKNQPTEIKNAQYSKHNEPIAIIGIACRFPESDDPDSYWKLLNKGIDAVSEIPENRWKKDSFYDTDPTAAGKAISKWGGFLKNIDQFDPFFFGISPGEAKQMDPQQRLLLEVSYEAFDNAGYNKDQLDGSNTGVFVGISVNEYSHLQLNNPISITSHSGTGNALSIAANRLSYYYNFHGPSLAIDTACSSSLVAVHYACMSLRNKESKMSIAAGVNIILSPAHSIAFTKAGVLAPDGRCKSFDKDANGYVRGEGVGAIVLKLLSEAQADGDNIHAVILGSAMSQDGRTNGLMAPSQESQETMLREAYLNSGISPADVHYVEAHGTGTLLGDAMEALALGNVIGLNKKNGYCAIGSVKSNIGHLESAAGMAGLLKTILAIKNKTIPPSIHYQSPNPHIPLNDLNLKVQDKAEPWPDSSGPAIAGVSSFGFGGTIAHLVLKETDHSYSNVTNIDFKSEDVFLLPLSANNNNSLLSLASDFRSLLMQNDSYLTNDICSAAKHRRSQFNNKIAIVGDSREELTNGLQSFLSGKSDPNLISSSQISSEGKLAFVFSGQGGQWIGMGRKLMQKEPRFYDSIKRIDLLIQELYNWSLIDTLNDNQSNLLHEDISVIQPAIFAVQIAIVDYYHSLGIIPDAVIGHSMGEVAAAYAAKVLSLKDAIKIICLRSIRLKSLSGKGSMLATELSKEQAEKTISDHKNDISIAAFNGPNSTVLSGDSIVINKIQNHLQGKNIWCKLVKVDVASHSPQMDVLIPAIIKDLAEINPMSPQIPVYSTVTASIGNKDSFNKNYWAENLRKPVRFQETIDLMISNQYSLFIEIGPHPILLSSISQSALSQNSNLCLLPSLHRDENSTKTLFKSLAQLYVDGYQINWDKLIPKKCANIKLPTIRWNRQRYWLDKINSNLESPWYNIYNLDNKIHPLLGEKISLAHSPSEHIWQSTISLEKLPYLNDHKVGTEVLYPASGFFEMALQAAKDMQILNSYNFENAIIQNKLILQPDTPVFTQSVISKNEDGTQHFKVYSKKSHNAKWTLNFIVNFSEKVTDKNPTSEWSESEYIKSSSEYSPTVKEIYREYQKRGIDYGKDFQSIKEVWIYKKECLGHIALPESLSYQDQHYIVHPILFDGALQISGTIINSLENNNIYIPTGFKKILFHSTAKEKIWVHVNNLNHNESDYLTADIKVYDQNLNPVLEIQKMKFNRIALKLESDHLLQHSWFYNLEWQQKDLEIIGTSDTESNKNWLIFSDNLGVSAELIKLLEARGDKLQILNYSEVFKKSEKGFSNKIFLDFLNNANSSLDGILHLWSLSLSDKEIYQAGCNSVMHIIQNLSKRLSNTPKLWLVTKGSQAVNHLDNIDVNQSPLWGMGKVISFEIPEFGGHCIDLDLQESSLTSATQLYYEITNPTGEGQIAFRSNNRYVQRLVPLKISKALYRNDNLFSKEASYLITGGLGGLGLSVAKWMVSNGANNLILTGRNKPSESASKVVENLKKSGAEITVKFVDVSDENKMESLFSYIKKFMPPLKGVIHAAGIIDDGSILNLDEKRMKNVMSPKVNGTRILHNYTSQLDLEYFVLFSSAVSVLGSPGQANYAAASSYLDSMSHYRNKEGLHSISINWGPWAEVGLAAEVIDKLEEENASTEHIVKMIKVEQGLEILGKLMRQSHPQVVVLPFDLKDLIDLYPMAAGMPFFSEIGGGRSHVSKLYSRPNLNQEYIAPRNEIETKLSELWQQTLHIDKVGIRDSFFELGGDSVLAAQVLGLARKTYGISINPQEAFKAFTIEKLSELLESEIIKQIDEMSEEQAKKLLSE